MSRFKSKRDEDTARYIANRHAIALGINIADNPDLMFSLMQKKGDFYKAELFPEEGARDAIEYMGRVPKRTPLMDRVRADMRRFYGYDGVPYDEKAQPTVVARTPVQSVPVATERGLIDVGPQQGPEPPTPQQVKAQEYKDQKTVEVMKQLDNIDRELKPKGMLLDDIEDDTLLWASAALVAGGGGGYLIGDQEEKDNVTIRV